VLSQVRGSLDQVQTVATRVGGALGLIGIAGVGGLVAMAKSVIDGVDALNDLKDATGSSIENISALEDVALRTGTSLDTVGISLVKFNQVLNDTDPDGKVAQALAAIGLSAKDLKQQDPAEALRQTAVALAGFADDGNKARLTQLLFGESLRELAPFLKDLSEQSQLNAKVTTEQTQAAEDFNKQLFELKKNSIDVSRALVGPLVEGINETIAAFRNGEIAGKGYLSIFLDRYWENIDKFYGKANDQQGYIDRLNAINTRLASGKELYAVQNALLTEKASLLKKIKDAPDMGADNQSSAENARLGRRPSLASIDGSGKPKKSGKSQAQKEQEEFERNRLKMQRQMAMDAGDAVTTENAAYQKSMLEQAAVTEKFIDSLMREEVAQAESNAKMREAAEEIGLTTGQVNALRLDRLDANIALEEQNQLTRFELGASADVLNFYQRKIELLKEQREITAGTQIRTAAADSKKEQDQASKQFADTLHGDLKGAFSAAFRDTKDPLGAFGDALANVVYTRAATSLAEAMATQAMSSGGGAGILSTVSSWFGFAEGGIMSSAGKVPVNAYASGGVANSPQIALFGEGRMNEAFVPLPDGKSIPVSLQGGGSAITINQPLVINAPNAGPETVNQIASMMPGFIIQNKRVIEAVIQQAMARRGGRFA
jgi:hypothetical protein